MENATQTQILSPKGTFPASVAQVIDNYKLVINRGKKNGIREGQRMLVYRLSDEKIVDPDTGRLLGYLELVRGTGRIISIQEKMSILESDSYLPNINIFISKNRLQFDNPKVGDKVKPI
jgi:hypothetical protein